MSKDDLYKKNVNTDGITKNIVGEQTIQTSKTKILKDSQKEVLIGKDLEEINKIKDKSSSLLNKILNK